ncbi:hypothetical protein BGZ60DRAFT_532301 [Tricladium varicosporioides]|nr:hypothetical protein BGZ60DRAFT_532301 [Hymenoscyphus varicosporioides]
MASVEAPAKVEVAQSSEVAIAPPTDTPKPALPTLHHLNNSQCQRILWLLEELGVEYNLIKYERTKPAHRAPPELSKIHPLGKSPTFVAVDGHAIVESSAIITCILTTYDTTGLFKASDPLHDIELTSLAGSSLGAINATQLLVELLARNTPWPIVYITRAIKSQVEKIFTKEEYKKFMSYLEEDLGEKEWFNGERLGRCDVMLSWPLDMIAERGWVDFKRDFPKLGAWRKRIEDRDAWKRGLEKGNGYELGF